MEVGERIALGFVEAERHRRLTVPGAEVQEIDGLLLAFANVRHPEVNSVLVISEPADSAAALAAAEARFRERDRPFGLDVAVGRHPAVDQAIRGAGLRLLFSWPALAVRVDALPLPVLPAGIRVEPIEDERRAAPFALVERAGFGSDAEISERFYAAGSYGVPGAQSFIAWDGAVPVGIASAHLHADAVGLLGIAVVPEARRRGIATALILIAARAFPADLVWLHTADEGARAVYERIGFRVVADWEVWVRGS